MANELKNTALCHSNYSLSQQTPGDAGRLCVFISVGRICSLCFLFQESGCWNGILEDDRGQELGQKRAATSRNLSC